MVQYPRSIHNYYHLPPLVFVFICILISQALAGCDLATNPDQEPGYQETLVNLQVQQTMAAQDLAGGLQQTSSAQNATLQAQQSLKATQLAQIPVASPTIDRKSVV